MDPLVVLLLFLGVGLGALSWWVGWRAPGPNPFVFYSRAAFLFVTFVGLPFLVGILAAQASAAGRLAALGVEPHPNVRHVVGAAFGFRSVPVWIFRADGEPEALIEHYLDPGTRPGWELGEYVPGTALILEREERRVQITARRESRGTWIAYHFFR